MNILLIVTVFIGMVACISHNGLILEKTFDRNSTPIVKELKTSRKLTQNGTKIETSVSFTNNSGREPEAINNMPMPNEKMDGYPEGTDLATQLTRPYLDFTDDLKEIVKRVLQMRRELQTAKEQNSLDASASIFLGHSYKQYDDHSYMGRKGYTGSSRDGRKLLLNKEDINDDFGGMDFRGIKAELDQFDYLGGKRLNKEELLDKLFGASRKRIEV